MRNAAKWTNELRKRLCRNEFGQQTKRINKELQLDERPNTGILQIGTGRGNTGF